MFYAFMNIVLNVLNVFVFIKTISYAIYEIKQNNNKFGGIISIVTEILVFALFIYILWIR